VEAPDGFIIQGIVGAAVEVSSWSDPTTRVEKETYTFLDDDVARFMEEALARRRDGNAAPDVVVGGTYERSLRVLGRYIDQQKPRDIFFLEQDGSYVVRLLMGTRQGARHVLAEFTADELAAMVDQGPAWRGVAV